MDLFEFGSPIDLLIFVGLLQLFLSTPAFFRAPFTTGGAPWLWVYSGVSRGCIRSPLHMHAQDDS